MTTHHGHHLPSIVLAALGAYVVALRPKQLRWGTVGHEAGQELPGDDIIPFPSLTATRAISIECAPDAVWPWIAQLGQGRGGFYSYDTLENLVGCDIHSAQRVVPEWQSIGAGDQVRLAPEVRLDVVVADPERALVLRGGVPMGASPPYDFTWTFALRPRSDGRTRLLIRERYLYKKWWTPVVVEPVEAISFLMTQKMLRGVRDRAERLAGAALSTS